MWVMMARRCCEGVTQRMMSASEMARGQVGGDVDIGGEDEAGKVGEVLAGVGELLGECGGVGPEAELVAAAAREREGECGAPGSGAEDGDAAHAAAFFLPKRLSVPARRRRMLAWCLTMTSSEMKRKPAMKMGVRYGTK